MLIINNRFLSLYDYNFLLVIEKIRKRNSKICGSRKHSRFHILSGKDRTFREKVRQVISVQRCNTAVVVNPLVFQSSVLFSNLINPIMKDIISGKSGDSQMLRSLGLEKP